MTTNLYVKFQPNKHIDGDCAVRSMVKALDLTWLEAFDALVDIARKQQRVPTSKEVFTELLESNGFVYVSTSKNLKGKKRPTVESFTKQHPEGTYVVRAAHHIVTVKDGKYYDAFDSGSSCLYGYWEKR